MYPLAPVRRMSDVLGIAAGFAVALLALMVSDIFTSHPFMTRVMGGRYPLRESFNYFFFMLFSIRSRVARYSLLPGSEVNAFSIEAIASACFSAPIATSA